MDDTLKRSTAALEKFMNSSEGAEYFADLKRRDRRDQMRIKKMHVLLSTASRKKLTELEVRFFEKEKKYQDRMLLTRHVETNSQTFSTLVGVFRKYGTAVESQVIDATMIKRIGEIDRSGMTPAEKVKATVTYLKRVASARRNSDMFLSSTFQYGKYILKTYSGQGVFYRIYRGRKQIW